MADMCFRGLRPFLVIKMTITDAKEEASEIERASKE